MNCGTLYMSQSYIYVQTVQFATAQLLSSSRLIARKIKAKRINLILNLEPQQRLWIVLWLRDFSFSQKFLKTSFHHIIMVTECRPMGKVTILSKYTTQYACSLAEWALFAGYTLYIRLWNINELFGGLPYQLSYSQCFGKILQLLFTGRVVIVCTETSKMSAWVFVEKYASLHPMSCSPLQLLCLLYALCVEELRCVLDQTPTQREDRQKGEAARKTLTRKRNVFFWYDSDKKRL